jgi:hypothetical protein
MAAPPFIRPPNKTAAFSSPEGPNIAALQRNLDEKGGNLSLAYHFYFDN